MKKKISVSVNFQGRGETLSGVWSATSNYKLKINYYVAIYILKQVLVKEEGPGRGRKGRSRYSTLGFSPPLNTGPGDTLRAGAHGVGG